MFVVAQFFGTDRITAIYTVAKFDARLFGLFTRANISSNEGANPRRCANLLRSAFSFFNNSKISLGRTPITRHNESF